jgi:hypothetical protein
MRIVLRIIEPGKDRQGYALPNMRENQLFMMAKKNLTAIRGREALTGFV